MAITAASREIIADTPTGLTRDELSQALEGFLDSLSSPPESVLMVVPDITRNQSYAGVIASSLYRKFLTRATDAGRAEPTIHVLPAVGTHVPMTPDEMDSMYPGIPHDLFLVHDWRREVVTLGEVPGEVVRELSDGVMHEPIPVQINRHLLEGYDLILSIGQVVPHEVVGMANYTKNLVVGAGGSDMINQSHYLGAVYGMERLLGRDHSPVRKLYDYAQEHFLRSMPLVYLLTVTSAGLEGTALHGLFIGSERDTFESAVALSQKINIVRVPKPLNKVVVWLDPEEFHSTWVGNKAIYRTRMAIADGGQLIVLAPGVDRFGEDPVIDDLIRRYGYTGRDHVIRMTREHQELADNLSASAHLIHGSSDGRFTITYCPGHLTEEEIRGVGFDYLDYGIAAERYYDPSREEGLYETGDGEAFYYIKHPALGLWMYDA